MNPANAVLRSYEATDSLIDMNQEVIEIILQSKKDIWKNKQLPLLVDEFMENCLLTLDFSGALDDCLKRAGHIRSSIMGAIRKFEEEHYAGSERGSSVKNYPITLEELRNSRMAGDPFTEEFFDVFNSIYSHQLLLLQRLQEKKIKLDNKLRKLKAWRRVSNVIFVAAFVLVLICTVVAAAISAPPVVTALAAAASLPLVFIGRWFNLTWKKRERDLMGQRDIVSSMQVGTYVVIKDLDALKVLTKRFELEGEIEALLVNADYAILRRGEAVVIAVEESKTKMDSFIKHIHDLSEHANKCAEEMRRARSLVLRRIINYPNR